MDEVLRNQNQNWSWAGRLSSPPVNTVSKTKWSQFVNRELSNQFIWHIVRDSLQDRYISKEEWTHFILFCQLIVSHSIVTQTENETK